LFSRITKCVHVHFQIQKLEKKLAVAEKELQQAVRITKHLLYISTLKGRKEGGGPEEEEGAQKKAEEEAGKKAK
jgi:hypothetical protein